MLLSSLLGVDLDCINACSLSRFVETEIQSTLAPARTPPHKACDALLQLSLRSPNKPPPQAFPDLGQELQTFMSTRIRAYCLLRNVVTRVGQSISVRSSIVEGIIGYQRPQDHHSVPSRCNLPSEKTPQIDSFSKLQLLKYKSQRASLFAQPCACCVPCRTPNAWRKLLRLIFLIRLANQLNARHPLS